MTYFESKGVAAQMRCGSIAEATKQYRRSCAMCARYGKMATCKGCAIKASYETSKASFSHKCSYTLVFSEN